MPLLVACATEREMAEALSWARPDRIPRQGESCRVEIAGRACLLLTTGVGPVSTAYHVGQTMGQAIPSGILCLGVAGTFDPQVLPMGGVVVASEERFADFGLAGKDGIDPRGIRLPQGTVRGTEVFDSLPLDPDAAAATLNLTLAPSWPKLPCLTVSAASGCSSVASARAASGCAMEAMEGFSLAYAAAHQELPFLEIRTISNLVGSRLPGDWNLPGALAALGEAAKTLFGQA